jgi:hypothetical protein
MSERIIARWQDWSGAPEFVSDGSGNWVDGSGIPQPRRAIDIDISATPFINTLPIWRASLKTDESGEIVGVYVRSPELAVETDRRRYTCLGQGRYRYDSLDSDFTREIEVNDRDLITTYPGLFRRIL